MKKKKAKYSISARIWIDENDDVFLGSGRVQLLEYIQETGSIANAAKLLSMSYRKAWQVVQELNNRSEKPLVEKRLGGKTGGGSELTETGRKAITTYKDIEKKVNDLIEIENKKLKF
ncbi:MAG: winged helix-turn-helix domain-containing protein [Bacteroidota bacterium]